MWQDTIKIGKKIHTTFFIETVDFSSFEIEQTVEVLISKFCAHNQYIVKQWAGDGRMLVDIYGIAPEMRERKEKCEKRRIDERNVTYWIESSKTEKKSWDAHSAFAMCVSCVYLFK